MNMLSDYFDCKGFTFFNDKSIHLYTAESTSYKSPEVIYGSPIIP